MIPEPLSHVPGVFLECLLPLIFPQGITAVVHGFQTLSNRCLPCLLLCFRWRNGLLALPAPPTPTPTLTRAQLRYFSRAVLDLSEVVKSNVDSKTDWNMIGLCRGQLGEPEAAEEAYRRALAIDPSFKVRGKTQLLDAQCGVCPECGRVLIVFGFHEKRHSELLRSEYTSHDIHAWSAFVARHRPSKGAFLR